MWRYHREWKENIAVAAFPNLNALYLCDFPLPEFLAMTMLGKGALDSWAKLTHFAKP